MGGLARRVTLLDRLRHNASLEGTKGLPTLTLVGAAEFLPDRAFPAPKKTGQAGPDQIRQAYNRQKVDAGVLSQAAAAWFGPAVPQGFFPVSDLAVSRRFPVTLASGEDADICVVFFPPLKTLRSDGSATPHPALLARVMDAGRAALSAATADGKKALLVGISPWGFGAELAALPELSTLFHVLLGAGDGAPFPAEAPDAGPSLLWSRADLDGKSLLVLDILSLPEATASGPAWDPALSARAHAITLSESIPADPAVEALLR